MPARTWSPPPLVANRWLRWGIAGATIVYLALALGSLEVNWARVAGGLERGWNVVDGFVHPNFVARWDEIVDGLRESLTITLTATVAGIAISIPIGLGAARNVVHPAVHLACRALIALARSFQAVIVALLVVALIGFGPFAGFLAIAFATVGSLSKLLAEDIEEADPVQLEAVHATGCGWLQWINYGVQPQVMPRLIGLCLYRLDINFRESATVGIVGAGGVGATLNTAIARHEFDVAAAILLIIIAIVMASEYASFHLRKWVQ